MSRIRHQIRQSRIASAAPRTMTKADMAGCFDTFNYSVYSYFSIELGPGDALDRNISGLFLGSESVGYTI